MTILQYLAKLGSVAPDLENLGRSAPAQPLLGPLALLEPRVLGAGRAGHEAAPHTSAGMVWKSLRAGGADADRLLNLRHFAVLGLQTKLRGLVQVDMGTSTQGLRLFLGEQTDHAYVDSDTYQGMASDADADEVLGCRGSFQCSSIRGANVWSSTRHTSSRPTVPASRPLGCTASRS